MSGKKKSTFASFCITVVVILTILLAVGLVVKYTKAGDKIKDIVNPAFCVEYDGKRYMGETNTVILPSDGQAKFTVKGAESYKIKVMPNVTDETNFTYEIGNEVYSFGNADLSKVFLTDGSIKNGSFYIDCTQDLSVESVLSKIHGGAEIKLNGEIDCPYLLTFVGADNAIISIALCNKMVITLSESNIII